MIYLRAGDDQSVLLAWRLLTLLSMNLHPPPVVLAASGTYIYISLGTNSISFRSNRVSVLRLKETMLFVSRSLVPWVGMEGSGSDFG